MKAVIDIAKLPYWLKWELYYLYLAVLLQREAEKQITNDC